MANIFIPSRQRLILCRETVAGTPVSTGGILGPTSNLQSSYTGSVTTENADLGLPINNFSITPNSGRSAAITFDELLRADGLAIFLLMGMMGKGSDTVVVATPNVHTGAINTAMPATYTAFHDTGLQNEYFAFPYTTAGSLSLAWSPTQSPTWSASLISLPPADPTSSAPTIATRTVAPRARTANAVYSYQSSTAGTTYPTADVVSGNLTFNTNCVPVVTGGSDPATDVAPMGIEMSGSFDLVYRGSGVHTAFADWKLWQEQGTSSNKNSIVWTPSDSNPVSISWYPMVFTSCQISPGGDVLHVSVAFDSSNQLAVANVASPTGTAPSSVVVSNTLATAMS